MDAVVTTVADAMVPTRARVLHRRRELADTWTLEIEPEDPGVLRFGPGQFNMLYAPGIGEVAISVSGDPAVPHHLVHTIRDVGKVSHALTHLRPGASLGVRGPFGSVWPVDAAAGLDVVVVAGGLGLAPLRPAIYRLLAERERFGQIALLYGTRSPAEILYMRELERWRQRLDVQLEVTVDHAGEDWHGHIGVVTHLIPRAAFDPEQTVAFVCGPEIMMRFAALELRDAGVADDAIHLSMERNMKCALGHCGRCQFGPTLVCRDGPVVSYDRIARLLAVKEL
ncbi:MAG TPA: FAD/NAD(P)-binding protein [Geminicoccaceae bacterium]|nr:FAD/NAD(P)-binding protein [Geminicoccaceae bacterium]